VNTQQSTHGPEPARPPASLLGDGVALTPADQISIHQAFALVRRRQPDRVAVSAGARELTYAQLDELSDRVAAGLAGRGVTRGDRVAVCLDRDETLIAVLLGVLKAGAAYVPIDPAYPAARREDTVAAVGARAVVAAAGLFPAGMAVVTPDELVAALRPPGHRPPDAGREDVAYVIFTSGSTGRPKGVVIAHGNVLALVAATRDAMGLGADDVWSMFHSAAFDVSVYEMWGCLLTGGRLVVVPYWTARTPPDFLDLLAARRVTVLSQTPSAFAQLIDEDRRRPADLAVRLVLFAGETLPVGMLGGWLQRHPLTGCRLLNLYGITETTVHTTLADVTDDDVRHGSRSVGRPLPGWTVSVRDEDGVPVPDGVIGEIWVGGAGTARGYWDQPELTAARFVLDPVTGQRVYRSGDLGRIGPDATIDHLGRMDDQVKVRGFRIEPAEIRSALLTSPAVAEAAIVVRGDGAGAVIEAYAVPSGPVTVPRLRDHLAGLLPDHLRPASITLVDAVPLTGNGKLDVAALRTLPEAPVAPAARPAASTGEIEDLMLDVWQRVLGEELSVYDDFSAVGGNSLLAARLCVAMQEAGLRRYTPREIYVHQTISELAQAVGRA
jgi:amino acid adenylation domain-containing protein